MAGKKQAGRPSQKGQGKNKQRSVPVVDIPDEEVAVSDEDVEFFSRGKGHAFLAKLDASKLEEVKKGKAKVKEPKETPEAYYERLARQDERADAEDEGKSYRSEDVLPIKTLEGELQYRRSDEAEGSEEGPSTVEDRRAALKRKKGDGEELQEVKDEEKEGDAKKSKKQQREELKKQKRDDKKRKGDEKKKGDEKEDEGMETEERVEAAEEEEQGFAVPTQEDIVASLREYASAQERRLALRLRMAEIGTSLLADPEGHMSALKELLQMCDDEDDEVAQLAMLSGMAVFKDICPGYRIRLPTAKELEVKVSKEVLKLRQFEASLLHSYRAYVQHLVKAAKTHSLRRAAVRSLCGLLVALPHFNLRESLLQALVPRMDAADQVISQLCCDAMRDLFGGRGSAHQEATLEAVQLIADFVRQRACRIHPNVIRVYLSLRFDEDLGRSSGTGEKANLGKVSKKKAKLEKRKLAAKLRKEVESDVREAEAVLNPSERRKLQSQTVAAVFETYFRVLKDADSGSTSLLSVGDGSAAQGLGPRPLLVAALEGLSRLSHLVSVDFMGDLLEVLRHLALGGAAQGLMDEAAEVAEDDVSLTPEEQLQCCVAAFRIVKGALDALNVDLRDFYVRLYQLLWDVPFEKSDTLGPALAEALENTLWESRQLDQGRVAGFAKRLAGGSLSTLDTAGAVAQLIALRRLLQRHPKVGSAMLDTDGGGGVAVYIPEAADPESSGALASCLWELTLLTRHFHPAVARLAADVAALAASRDAIGYLSFTPTEAVAAYSTVSGGFRPGIQAPRKKTGGKTGGGKRKPGLSDSFKKMVQEDEVGVSGEEVELVGRSFRVLFRQVRDHRENVTLRKEQRRMAAVKLKMRERETLQAKLRAKKERKLKSKLRDREARTSGKETRVVDGGEKVAEKRERIGEKVAEKRGKGVVDCKEKAAIKQKKRTG